MYQLICGLALVGLTVGPARANLTFTKDDGSQAVLVIPEDATAAVFTGDQKLVSGRTVLDPENARDVGRNAIRLVPDQDSACPPVSITFNRDYANLNVLTEETGTVRGAGTCAMQTIAGRYQLKRPDRDAQ